MYTCDTCVPACRRVAEWRVRVQFERLPSISNNDGSTSWSCAGRNTTPWRRVRYSIFASPLYYGVSWPRLVSRYRGHCSPRIPRSLMLRSVPGHPSPRTLRGSRRCLDGTAPITCEEDRTPTGCLSHSRFLSLSFKPIRSILREFLAFSLSLSLSLTLTLFSHFSPLSLSSLFLSFFFFFFPLLCSFFCLTFQPLAQAFNLTNGLVAMLLLSHAYSHGARVRAPCTWM